tara:strand:- start:644 stop:919 length:276 start_codon:yes stop_codon:yes gene_type:complete
VEENNNINLVEKVTPSHTLDWYVKWVATAFIIAGVICRSAGPEYALYDLIFGVIGTALWGWVSMIWQDRALIILNTTMFIILVVGLLKALS